jgi:hypothetical protein
MPGRYVSRVWTHDPTIDAPAKYRRACGYEAFIPVKLAELPLSLDAHVAGTVSEADAAIRELNAGVPPSTLRLAMSRPVWPTSRVMNRWIFVRP